MPVLSETHNPSTMKGHQTTNSSLTSNGTYILLSFAILITLGLRLQQQRRRREDLPHESSTNLPQKTPFSNAQTMQTPPSSSALPEKPFLPDLESKSYDVDHEKRTLDLFETSTDSNRSTSPSSLPSLANSQLASDEATFPTSSVPDTNVNRAVSIHMSQQRRPGSLIHPEPPAPTITMKDPLITIQTQQPYKQAQEYHFEDNQPEYQSQYFHNEILFVPSPTEYTSFEALYSKFPPPIYHEPNPTSYTSISASEISDSDTASYSTSSFSGTDGTADHHHNTDLPRRRSYTKTLSNGSEMYGEIVVSGGRTDGLGSGQWRRHTRVFGGGICVACEESESRRMTA